MLRSKVWLTVLGSATAVAVALGAWLSTSSWQKYQDALDTQVAALSTVEDAQYLVDWAEEQYTSTYIDYEYCYWFCSWALNNWLTASDNLDSAKASLESAQYVAYAAAEDVDKTSDDFNRTLILSIIISSALFMGLIAVAILAYVRRKRDGSGGAHANFEPTSSTWTCPDCNKPNDSGLFCVECGTKRSPGTASAPAVAAPETSSPAFVGKSISRLSVAQRIRLGVLIVTIALALVTVGYAITLGQLLVRIQRVGWNNIGEALAQEYNGALAIVVITGVLVLAGLVTLVYPWLRSKFVRLPSFGMKNHALASAKEIDIAKDQDNAKDKGAKD